ncbi:hypothetical protein HKX48_005186 [Thoreauomyces humboldtii]|nr:hypothetical protein HKX48_005186 [Thoreauomyces humboldtii]
MFASGPQDTDIMTEFLALQKGIGYTARPSASTLRHCDGRDEVFIRIDLAGIHLAVGEEKGSDVIAEYTIEEIVKYSHSRAKRRFCFSQMDVQGVLREFKFESEKYFEIFEALGRAIAVVIKIKSTGNVPIAPPLLVKDEGSLASLLEAEEPQDPSKQSDRELGRVSQPGTSVLPRKARMMGNRGRSMGELFSRNDADHPSSASPGGSTSLMQPEDTTEAGQKAALAKYYIQSRYSHPAADSPSHHHSSTSPSATISAASVPQSQPSPAFPSATDSTSPRRGAPEGWIDDPTQLSTSTAPTTAASTTPSTDRKWKSQMRYDYLSISKARFKSDPHHLSDDPPTAATTGTTSSPRASRNTRASLASQYSVDHGSTDSLASRASETMHVKTASEPFLSLNRRSVAERPSVLGLFVKEGTLRPRSKSERPGSENVGSTVKLTGGDVHEKEKNGNSGSGFMRIASKMTMRKKGSSVWPSKDGLASSADMLFDGPKVVILKDDDGKEILIKNRGSEGYQIVAGTVDALVAALLNQPDAKYLEEFLLTFRHIMDPKILMERLTTRFQRHVEHPNADGVDSEEENLRIVTLVKKWAGDHAYDFLSPDTFSALQTFLDGVQANARLASYSSQIRSLATHALSSQGYNGGGDTSSDEDSLTSTTSTTSPSPWSPTHELLTLLREFDFLSQSSRRIAQQLTLVDSRLFRSIRPEEFTLLLWDRTPLKPQLTSNLQRYIARFNRVGYWVGTVVCSYAARSQRTEALEKFVKVAIRSMEVGNYNTAMAILSGLNTTPVSRLKRSFSGMSRTILTAYEDLETRLSYRSNYKVYRDIEDQCRCRGGSVIPFFGLVIKDLTFLNDGNSSHTVTGLVNWEKMREVYDKVQGIREFQRGQFPWIPDDEVIVRGPGESVTLHSYCSSPPCMGEDQLLLLSKAMEGPDGASVNRGKAAGAGGAAGTGSVGRSGGRTVMTQTDVLLEILNGKTDALDACGGKRDSVISAVAPTAVTCTTTSVSPITSDPLDHSTPSPGLTVAPQPSPQPPAVSTDVPPRISTVQLMFSPPLDSPLLGSMMREYDAKSRTTPSSPSPSARPASAMILSPTVSSPGSAGASSIRRQSLAEKGGTLRRKLSENGFGGVLGWWKKEDEDEVVGKGGGDGGGSGGAGGS